jgi:four helix bundle protein
MMSVVINKKMQVSSGASAVRNMAVWEGGYNICVEVCRAADKSGDQSNAVIQQLKNAATAIPMNLAKGASFRLGRQYIRSLKSSYVSAKQAATLLLLCHDLGYVETEEFLDLNSKLNEFATKLKKFIRFSQKRYRQKMAKK